MTTEYCSFEDLLFDLDPQIQNICTQLRHIKIFQESETRDKNIPALISESIREIKSSLKQKK
jgi:hypothetical protein